MAEAIAEARRGAEEGEVPVGAIAVRRIADGADDVIVAVAHNRPIALSDPTAHAEMLALRQAAAALGAYRLEGAALFVTLEPCVMCVGADVPRGSRAATWRVGEKRRARIGPEIRARRPAQK